MKFVCATVCGLAVLGCGPAVAKGWTLTPAAGGHDLQLSYGTEAGVSYLFDCRAADIAATLFGATKLLDIKTGQTVGDAPGSVMTPGANLMTLFTGAEHTDFLDAEVVPNAVNGWDLTIHFSKNDELLRSFGHIPKLSLATTGDWTVVEMDEDDQALARDFLKGCAG